MNNWSEAMTNDVMARKELQDNFKKYMAGIAAQRAAFKKTAKATWPPAFRAYADSLKEFDEKVYGINWDKMH